MFKLFANIFELFETEPDGLPKSLIKEAIERAVDGTDPRIRMVPGYAKKLHGPVVHAAEHVIQLIDDLPEPVCLSPDRLASDPAIAAIFYSAERQRRILSRDAALKDFRKQQRHISEPVYALLAVQTKEKHGFGVALVDGKTRKDVAQTTVSFDEHRLLEPTFSEQETRRLLKRRAFDAVLAAALLRLTEQRNERKNLTQRKSLLRCKLDIVKRHGSFQDHHAASEQHKLQQRMEEIEQQLSELGPDEAVLPANLATIAEVLEQAEHQLWIEEVPLCLDRYYVLQPPGGPVPSIPFKEIRNSQAEKRLLLLVKLEPDLLSAA